MDGHQPVVNRSVYLLCADDTQKHIFYAGPSHIATMSELNSPADNPCNNAAFRNLFLSTAHPTLTMARDGTPHVALRKGGTKQYETTKMWILYINS
jgi:hypothetical protein